MPEQKVVLSPQMASDFEGELDGVADSIRELLPDAEIEIRDPSKAPPGLFGPELGELLTVILPLASEYTFDRVMDAVIERLRAGRRKRNQDDPSPRVKFYGPNGEILKEVEVDESAQHHED